MRAEEVQAIDVHGHMGTCRGAPSRLLDRFCSGDGRVVVDRARMANTELTLVSSLRALLPRGSGDPVAGNMEAAREVEGTPGLLLWTVVDPLKPETYGQALELLAAPKCVGVKIHPEEHGYPIREHGRAIFQFAEQHGIVLQSHSGCGNSMPEEFLVFANEFPAVKIIVSHLGWGWDGDVTHQVRAIQESKHGNLFTDTSSMKQITPGLLEWAVQEIGAEKILYGTDTPLYFAPMQRCRVDCADISDDQKRLILRENAIGLLDLA